MQANNELVDATSEIKEVTVYENRAQVHRHATVSLQAGPNSVVLGDLPRALDKASLQVGFVDAGGAAPSGVVLRGIQFDTKTTPNPEYAAAMANRASETARAEALRKAIRAAQDDAEAVKQRQAQNAVGLSRALSGASGAEAAVFDPATWATVVGSYQQRLGEQLAEQRAVEDRLQALQQELEAADAARRVEVPRELTRSVVSVNLHAAEEVTKAVLVVSYLVSGASWESEYEVRVKSETLAMTVHYYGVIKQRTEEDWRNAQVSLSTARPAISGRQPELTPWRVGIAKPVVLRAKRSCKKSMGGMSLSSRSGGGADRCIDEDDDLEEAICELSDYSAPVVEASTVSEAATSVSFNVPRPLTVLRDGEPTHAALQTIELAVTLQYVTAPAALEAVYASATAMNTSDLPLAAGEASVFLDGQFVTRSSLPRTAPGEELVVSVGRDEGVQVKRKMLNKKRSDEGGMWSGRRDVLTYSFVNTVKNTKRVPVSVKLQERVPASDDEELAVALLRPATLTDAEKKKLKDEGILEVPITVKPNESVEWTLEFTVTAPEGRTVYGL